MNNKALIKWLDDAHKQEVFIQEMGFDEDGDCERNKMHIEALKRLVESCIHAKALCKIVGIGAADE